MPAAIAGFLSAAARTGRHRFRRLRPNLRDMMVRAPGGAARAGLVAALAGGVTIAAAQEMPSFAVVLRDGTISPARLEVPANQPFKLEISNAGSTPSEFESLSLHKEKVLSAGVTSSLVIRRLPPGEYDFFDDFHPDAKAVLVAR